MVYVSILELHITSEKAIQIELHITFEKAIQNANYFVKIVENCIDTIKILFL